MVREVEDTQRDVMDMGVAGSGRPWLKPGDIGTPARAHGIGTPGIYLGYGP
jgi:hypothetical protein